MKDPQVIEEAKKRTALAKQRLKEAREQVLHEARVIEESKIRARERGFRVFGSTAKKGL